MVAAPVTTDREIIQQHGGESLQNIALPTRCRVIVTAV